MKPIVALTAGSLLACAAGCAETPAEPARRGVDAGGAPGPIAAPTASLADPPRAPPARPLEWEIPAGWSVERTADRGSYRLKAQVPPVGNDKAPADFLARVVGRSDGVDVEEELASFFREFDGDVQAHARRDELDAGVLRVRVFEVAGDYKRPMGPPMGPRGKHAAYVIQRGWRGIVAVTTTPQREVWLFRLVGPSDTVESSRSAMHALLRSLRVVGSAEEPAPSASPAPRSSQATEAAHEH